MGALTGKRALVTCGSRGIGRAVVERLARAGAAVVFSLFEHGPPGEVVETIEAAGGKAWTVPADLGDLADRAATVRGGRTALGALDLLVNNAGRAADAHRSDDRGGVRPRHGGHAKVVGAHE